ncbi:cyclodeaminase/cyclohydrolase family protein, partial [bacterium]|nr:cyclodeaminase/cyclohydrolase family protein [bacterium]
YGKVSTAYRMPKSTDEEKAKRSRAIQEACKEALGVPLEATKCCHEILKLSQRLADIGNVNLVSDVGVAAVLAEAALHGAALNVEINLANIKDDNFVGEKGEILEPLLREGPVIKDEVLSKVKEKMKSE